MSKKPKKRIIDISRPVRVRRPVKSEVTSEAKDTGESFKISKSVARSEQLDKEIEKRVEESTKKLDHQIEEFEKKEKDEFEKTEKDVKKPRKRRRFFYLSLSLTVLLMAGGVYGAIRFLPKADIKITTKKTDWNYNDSLTADKNISQVNAGQKQIPAEIFSSQKNFTFSAAATGKKKVQQKASGKITVYNAYSSDTQTLVASTRFMTPDGKIFRLDKNLVVPGAKIIGGKIVPSSIETTVTADQPGPNYNIGPVNRFNIPGFQGSSKYQGFYASSDEAMKGGFIGEVAYPTDADIKSAKENASQQLQDSIEASLALQMPQDFKVINGSKQFNILKQEVNLSVDEKDNFSVYTEAQSVIIAFRESDMEKAMVTLAQADFGNNFEIKSYSVQYGAGRPDFKQGKISSAVDFKGVFDQPVDVTSLKQQALNKTEGELKMLIFSLPGIEKAVVSFWPFWVKQVPNNLNRVSVEVE